MSIKVVATEAPKKSKGASKKNKKSWRKNTSIEDIEEFLDDQRLEERLGGAFDQRKDEDLFMVDSKPVASVKTDEAKLSSREKRRARSEKPLKCYQHLTISGGVADPVKVRNRRRTLEERKNPIVSSKEIDLQKKGIVKAKEKTARKHRQAEMLRKAATKLERTTRRRTEFDFDLWSSTSEATISKVNTNEWLESETKRHTLKNTGKIQRKLPADLNKKTSLLPAVDLPHPGASYNPSLKDHQDLLWRAALVELKKEKEQHRIDFHTTNMFPKKEDAPTLQTWLDEMSEGVDVLARKADNSTAENGEQSDEEKKATSDEEDQIGDDFKLKTRKQRRKAIERRAAERRKLAEKSEQMKYSEVFRLKSIKREIKEAESVTAQRMVKRKAAKAAKLLQPAKLSGHKYEEPDLEIKLTDELTGNLRNVKPEGNLILDRFKSLQKRNVIETRVRQKQDKTKRKKRAEKRSYKMGFSWEK